MSEASAHIDGFARERLPPRAQWPAFEFDLPVLRYPPRLNCGVELLDRMVATTMPPAMATANQAATKVGLLAARISTRLPGTSPNSSVSTRAMRLARSSSWR